MSCNKSISKEAATQASALLIDVRGKIFALIEVSRSATNAEPVSATTLSETVESLADDIMRAGDASEKLLPAGGFLPIGNMTALLESIKSFAKHLIAPELELNTSDQESWAICRGLESIALRIARRFNEAQIALGFCSEVLGDIDKQGGK